jgi:S1-C subfamily serine protease
MKRITAAFPASAAIAFLLLTPYSHGQQPQRNVSEVVKATVDSVVLIVVSDEGGKPAAEGSGFIASSDGKMVTNHHVIAGAHSAGHFSPLTELSLTTLTMTSLLSKYLERTYPYYF